MRERDLDSGLEFAIYILFVLAVIAILVICGECSEGRGQEPRIITASRVNNDPLAISALDAAWIQQYLVGKRTFTPDQMLAADVTGDGTVSSLDAAYIQKYVVGKLTHFPAALACGSDFLFVPEPTPRAGVTVVMPSLKQGACTQGQIVLDPSLSLPAHELNFRAILLGDVTMSWREAPASTPTPVGASTQT